VGRDPSTVASRLRAKLLHGRLNFGPSPGRVDLETSNSALVSRPSSTNFCTTVVRFCLLYYFLSFQLAQGRLGNRETDRNTFSATCRPAFAALGLAKRLTSLDPGFGAQIVVKDQDASTAAYLEWFVLPSFICVCSVEACTVVTEHPSTRCLSQLENARCAAGRPSPPTPTM
jgi:hypothetical protein